MHASFLALVPPDLARHCCFHWHFQFFLRILNCFFELSISRIDKVDASLLSCIVEVRFFFCPFLLFFFETMMMKAVRATSKEVTTTTKVRRTERRNQLDTSTLDKGGAQRACGGGRGLPGASSETATNSRTAKMNGKATVLFDGTDCQKPPGGLRPRDRHVPALQPYIRGISTDNRSATEPQRGEKANVAGR